MIDWEKLKAGFERVYKESPMVMARAPGRVNLIGEHIDYIGGHVLPIAVDMGVGAAISKTNNKQNEIFSAQYQHEQNAEIHKVERFVRALQEKLSAPRVRLFVDSDLPIGAGLSSSAAFSVSVASALIALIGGIDLSGLELARLCVSAEQDALGTKCGLMDPFTAIFAQKDKALLLNCADESHKLIDINLASALTVVIDSGEPRTLAQSSYNQRRQEIDNALSQALKRFPSAHSIWEVRREVLNILPELEPLLAKRLRHAITEDDRVLKFAEALSTGQVSEMGKLLIASHKSLRDDYEVSTPAIDFLVDELIAQPGVHGARIVGGGFGGSVLALVEASSRASALSAVITKYKNRFGRTATPFVVSSHHSAEVLIGGNAHNILELLRRN